MKRIECQTDGCTQRLTPEDRQCNRCGKQQLTRGWLLILLVLYYPIAALVWSLAAAIVGGLFAPVALGEVGPIALLGLAVAVYLVLAAGSIRRYVRRRRRIQSAREVAGYSSDGCRS